MPVRTNNSGNYLSHVQQILDLSLDVICSIDAKGRFIWVSAAAKDVWGYEPEELIGIPYQNLIVPEDRERTRLQAEAVMAGSLVTHFENHYIRKDGHVVPVVWSARWDRQSDIMYCVAKDATDKEEAERKAQDFEQRLYRAYKLGQIGWWEWNAIDDRTTVADELYKIYGLDKATYPTITTDLYLSLVHPEDLPKVLAEVKQGSTKPQHQYEHRMIKPSGKVIYVMHHVESERDENGKLLRIHGIVKDISDSKLAELNLRESEQKLNTILESIGDCFFALDKDWVVTYWNRQSEELLNKKREDIIGKNIWEEYNDNVTLSFLPRYQEAIRENKAINFEAHYPQTDMWVEISAYPSAEGLSVYFKDITERKRNQEALRKINQRYELASKATSDAIWDLDLQEKQINWGEGFWRMFGHNLENQTSHMDVWTGLLHPEDVNGVVNSLERVIEGDNNNWAAEYRFLKADGSYAYVLDKGFVIRDENGKAVRMVGAMQDNTQQKKAEQSIKVSEERFRLLFYQSPVPKWMVNGETLKVVEVNEAALKLYGYAKEEFLKLSLQDLILDEDRQGLKDFNKQQLADYKDIIRHQKKNGEVISLEVTTHAIELPSGLHFIVIGGDVTEKIALQQLVLEEKFAAQKEVSKAIINTQENERSEIAKELHDNVNQLLTTAKLYIENISYFPDQKDAFTLKGIELLQRSINEIRSLSKQLVTPVINDIGFKATLDELLNHYSSLNLFLIDLEYRLEEEKLEKGLILTIYRIIQEQLNNIVKYARASSVRISVTTEVNGLEVVISDNGVGFDRHKTTTGLGLKNMKNRAEIYKGDLRIRSTIGKGTTVQVTFPLPSDEEK